MTSIPGKSADPPLASAIKAVEVAAIFRVTPRTVARWADAGLLTCTRTPGGGRGPGHRRYTESAVRALLAGAAMRGAR
jgi:DNA-binding transcriptional MerR regulator